MICRYYLKIGAERLDVSSMIANVHDVEVSYVRVGMGGVIRKCGSTIRFVGDARERLVSLFSEKGLQSAASFSVQRLSDTWTFEPFFECPLDFSSFKYDYHTAEIGCLDSSAAALIKAGKSVEREFSVSELKEANPLEYDGLQILNDTSFQIIGNEVEGESRMEMYLDRNVWWWIPRLGVVGDNLVNNQSLLVNDQEEFTQTDGTDSGWGFPSNSNVTACFAECIKDCTVTVDFSEFSIKDPSKLGFALFKISQGTAYPLTCGYSNLLSLDNNTKLTAVKWSGRLAAGDKLQYAVFNHDRMYNMSASFWIMPETGTLKWYGRSAAVDIDVVTPLKLLDRILASISEGHERIYGGIKDTMLVKHPSSGTVVELDNARYKGTLLAASDSIRNMPDAKIRTSFDDFCKFMEAEFGYVYEILMRPKGSGIPDYIIANSYDFSGMTDLHTNITSVDSPNAVIQFSTSDKAFVGVVYESSFRDCSKDFPGYERYQTYIKNEGYKVHTDRYYHDTVDDVYYSATVYQHTLPDTGTTSWKAELHECVVEGVSAAMFKGVKPFGSIISDVEAFAETAYSGAFDAACVTYVRRKRMFVYVKDGNAYTSFPEGSAYNMSRNARKDMLYNIGEQKYCIMGTALMKCTVAEGEVELSPFVYFRHRDELFTRKGGKRIMRSADFQYKVSRRIYSQITVGYEKQDYDIGNNGKDEFNFSVTYTTGRKLTDTKFSLLSPYRADSYGFEEIAEKRGEETSSTSSDGGIFAVFCVKNKKNYTLHRSLSIIGVNTDSMFNAVFSPMHMIDANSRYLASFADALKFASTDGNSSVKIEQRPITGDIEMKDALFGCGDITFSSGSYVIPEDWNGIEVEIEACGKTYRGFLQSLDIAADETEILKYKLIESNK